MECARVGWGRESLLLFSCGWEFMNMNRVVELGAQDRTAPLLQPIAASCDLGRSRTTSGNLGQLRAISDNLGQLRAISGNLGRSRATSGDLGQSWATSGNLGRSRVISADGHLELGSQDRTTLGRAYSAGVSNVGRCAHTATPPPSLEITRDDPRSPEIRYAHATAHGDLTLERLHFGISQSVSSPAISTSAATVGGTLCLTVSCPDTHLG